MTALNRGYYVTTVLAMIGFLVASHQMLSSPQAPGAWVYFFACGVIGLLMAQAFVYITQYYTEYKYRPVKSIAEASQTGPATNIITGIAVGLECTAIPTVVISIAIIASYYLGRASGIDPVHPDACRTVRYGGRHHGHAGNCGLHLGDGHVRSDHRQCRRHRRDEPAAGEHPQEDGPAGCGRQHHQGPDERIRDRLCGAGRLPVVLRLYRRGRALRQAAWSR